MTREEKIRKRTRLKKFREMIRTFGDPILSKVCEPVDRNDPLDWLPIVANVCNAFPKGVGLAAPQAGILKQAVFIFLNRKNGYFMLNPVITEKSTEMVDGEEGCLSYPGYGGIIQRHAWIVIEYYTENWEKVTRKISGFEAVIVQHEIDHLMGICRVKEFWVKDLDAKALQHQEEAMKPILAKVETSLQAMREVIDALDRY